MDIQRINPCANWSDATVFNNMVHFVEIAADVEGDMLSQTEQLFAQAEATLASVGSDKSRLLSVTIYVTDFANVAVFNKAWQAWLPEGCAPSRACLKVELADPSYLVEIAFVAAVK
ncbi:RidA family protein [Shewanella pneumatophori]|uniref:RidA family protein n=1 Tax=Shewanella pneumatophori TaxID=314092 RepID=A0A9X2CGH7_9GAMM|nr:RidA family protein [Shewanella pneumatophori]MCL1139006.1 RidA family protein [Shewanella pneumatophori]